MTSDKISVFIAEDHPLMQRALVESIQSEPDMKVIGTASDGVTAIEAIPHLDLDIVIMDLILPSMDGLDAIKKLNQICPNLPILAFSAHESDDIIFKAVRAGAKGFLTKVVRHEELFNAIRVVSKGKSYLPSKFVGKIMDRMREETTRAEPSTAFDSLTNREKEVLGLLGKGFSNKKIAKVLVIAHATVRVHTLSIMKKMGFESRGEAIVYAVKRGIK